MTRIYHWFFYVKDGSRPCQALTSVLCLHYRSETVHCSTKDVYTSEITFLALHPCIYMSSFLSILLGFKLFLWRSMCLNGFLSFCLGVYVSVWIYVSPSIYLSWFLSICLKCKFSIIIGELIVMNKRTRILN